MRRWMPPTSDGPTILATLVILGFLSVVSPITATGGPVVPDLTFPYSPLSPDLDGNITPGEYPGRRSVPELGEDAYVNIGHDGAFLHIGLETQSAEWVGVGFREDPARPFFGMQGADLIMFSNASVADLLGLTGDLTYPLLRDVDDGGTEDIRYWGEGHAGSRQVIEFLYPLWSADQDHDARLDPAGGPYLMLLAMDLADPEPNAYHGMTRTRLVFDLEATPWASAGETALWPRGLGGTLLGFLSGGALVAVAWLATVILTRRR